VRTIDPITNEPLYLCYTCNRPMVPGDRGTYSKDHKNFCSIACVYIYYEGEPVAQSDDFERTSNQYS